MTAAEMELLKRTGAQLAGLIRLAAGLVALVIAIGIAFKVLDASTRNAIVSDLTRAARTLAGPFDGMFHPHGAKATIAVNWGVALVVYLIAGSILASLVGRLTLAVGSLRPRRRMA
jgi:hypothetical protein